LEPSSWSFLGAVQQAWRDGHCDGVGIMLGCLGAAGTRARGNGTGDACTLVAVRIGWWLRPFVPLLGAAWLEFDPGGHGYQALVLVADADLAWVRRAWCRSQRRFPRPDDAELSASPRFLPLSGVCPNGRQHQAGPACDLPLLNRPVLEQVLAAEDRRRVACRTPGGASGNVVPFPG
jgi:hypothetical protein